MVKRIIIVNSPIKARLFLALVITAVDVFFILSTVFIRFAEPNLVLIALVPSHAALMAAVLVKQVPLAIFGAFTLINGV